MAWTKIDNEPVFVIGSEPDAPDRCELCGKKFKPSDLRPYGPNEKWVCFKCGMKDEESAIRNFLKLIIRIGN